MSGFPGSPRLVKGGVVLLDPGSGQVRRVISLQYNPDSLTRSFQVQAVGEGGQDRSEALRLKAPAVESYRLEAEIDLTDRMEFPEGSPDTALGLHPQLAALETLAYPSSAQLEANNARAKAGMLEIIPMETPLTLFVWSKNRIVPVRLTEFSVTEEAFDPNLNPIRAKVSLGMRVLSVHDLGFDHRGGGLFMSYLRQKEGFARRGAGSLSQLGITGIP